MAEFAQKRANSAIATLALCAKLCKLILATYLHQANLMQIRFFVLPTLVTLVPDCKTTGMHLVHMIYKMHGYMQAVNIKLSR